jgi:hypothetical protein
VPGAFLQEFCHASEGGAGVFEMQNTFGHVFHNLRPLLATWHLKKMKAPLVLGERRGKQSWENNNSSCTASKQGTAAAFDVSRVFSSLVK